MLKKPHHTDYGLPSDFDFDAHNKKIATYKKNANKALNFLLAIVYLGCVVGIINDFEEVGVLSIISALFLAVFATFFSVCFALLVCAIPGLLVFKLYSRIIRPVILKLKSEKDFSPLVDSYYKDLHEWEDMNLETGKTYWTNLRGTNLEVAIWNLFRRRGANAEITKSIGDGGVDLKLYFEDITLFCQIKGYKSKVSVAPIRELAGVCSNTDINVIPIFFAVNGYTKGAQEESILLRVRLFNTSDLVRLANLEKIDWKDLKID